VESDGIELADEVLIPYAASLLLAIDVLMDLENIIPISFHLKALRDFHAHVPFSWGLGVSHDKVNLLMPALNDGFGKNETYGAPCHDWHIGIPIVTSLDLARAVNVETCLPLVDLSCLDLAFLFHLPDHLMYSGTLWNLGPDEDGEILPFELGNYLFHHGSYEFVPVGLFHHLMQVHGVGVLGGCKCDSIWEQCLNAEQQQIGMSLLLQNIQKEGLC